MSECLRHCQLVLLAELGVDGARSRCPPESHIVSVRVGEECRSSYLPTFLACVKATAGLRGDSRGGGGKVSEGLQGPEVLHTTLLVTLQPCHRSRKAGVPPVLASAA